MGDVGEMQEVGIQAVRGHPLGPQPSRGEVLHSLCCSQSVFRCIRENTCTRCPEHSNIWRKNADLKRTSARQQAARAVRKVPQTQGNTADVTSFKLRTSFPLFPLSGVSPHFVKVCVILKCLQ